MRKHLPENRYKHILWLSLIGACCLFTACAAPVDPPKPPDRRTPPVDNTLDQRAKAPADFEAGKGIQFKQPEQIIKAGTEKMICWIPDWVPDKEYLITQFEGIQGSMGHHVVALGSSVPRKPGEVFDCTDLEQMTALEPLILPDLANEKLLPDNHAVVLPKGSRIVIQSHYVNTTDKDIKIADVARFHFHTAKEKPTITSYLIFNHGAVDIKPGKQKVELTCNIKKQLNLLLMLGHMHEFGTAIKIEHQRDQETKMLYEVGKWTVDFRDEPPITKFNKDAKAPFLALQAGDKLKMTCNYNNHTEKDLRFPAEMCTMVAYYHSKEASGIINCKAE